jgi:hypothetical protein
MPTNFSGARVFTKSLILIPHQKDTLFRRGFEDNLPPLQRVLLLE